MDEQPLERTDMIEVDELLVHFRKTFLEHAYRVILKREVDRDAYHHWITALDRGEMTRLDILGQLRSSTEGIAAGVEVRGLRRKLRLERRKKKPLIGFFARLADALATLPLLASQISEKTGNALEIHGDQLSDFAQRSEKMQKHLGQSMFDNRAAIDQLTRKLDELGRGSEGVYEQLVTQLDEQRRQFERLSAELQALTEEMAVFKRGWFHSDEGTSS